MNNLDVYSINFGFLIFVGLKAYYHMSDSGRKEVDKDGGACIHDMSRESEGNRCTEEEEEEEEESEFDENDSEVPVYHGSRDSCGEPHGRGTLKWPSTGNRFEGRFAHGAKSGRGRFHFSDGSVLSGFYDDDGLSGWATYTYPDGRVMEAEYKWGELNGAFVERCPDGSPMAFGRHEASVRTGFLQLIDEFGGVLAGKVEEGSGGLLSGDGIAYVYPDHATALIGRFREGVMMEARNAVFINAVNSHEIADKSLNCVPVYRYREDYPAIYQFDESTGDRLSSFPLVPDAYEQDRVYVAQSLISGAGEGLFARRDLSPGEVASFYNGLRVTHVEVDARDWTLNQNTLSLDEETVIDVPQSASSLDVYCASLGHKANHSHNPTCEYAPFCHPRFGNIKCVKVLAEAAGPGLRKGEELTCDYGYEHKVPGTNVDDLPSWFKCIPNP